VNRSDQKKGRVRFQRKIVIGLIAYGPKKSRRKGDAATGTILEKTVLNGRGGTLGGLVRLAVLANKRPYSGG